METLLLPPAKSRKNYYVDFSVNGETTCFLPFYGKDYKTDFEAKKHAFSVFKAFGYHEDKAILKIELLEAIGYQIAGSNEPFMTKSITKILSTRYVK